MQHAVGAQILLEHARGGERSAFQRVARHPAEQHLGSGKLTPSKGQRRQAGEQPGAVPKGLELRLAMASGVPSNIRADSTRLRQVMVNLLGNAVKLTAHGSVELRVRLSAGGFKLRLDVVDTGPGIPAEKHHQLFHDFERLEAATLSTAEGAGLGLAISAQLVALMGGHLNHEDDPAGGSLFFVEIPQLSVMASGAQPPSAGDVSEPDASRFEPRSVLAADPLVPTPSRPHNQRP